MGPPCPQLVLMARWPAPGRCKSRLASGVGIERAAAIQVRLGGHGIHTALEARRLLSRHGERREQSPGLDLVLATSGVGPRASRRWGTGLGIGRVVAQGEGSLGVRLQRQVVRALGEGAPAVVLIGSDLPDVSAGDLVEAILRLRRSSLVLGPARDGGYWLLGLGRAAPSLFCGIDWGSDRVLAQTLAAARRLGLDATLVAEKADLDRPEDLRRWR